MYIALYQHITYCFMYAFIIIERRTTYSIYSNINKIHGKTPDMKSYTSHTKPWSTVSSNSKIRPTGTTKCSISLLSNYWDLADCKPLQSTPLIKRSLLHPSDYTHIYIYACTHVHMYAYTCVCIYIYIERERSYIYIHIYIYIYHIYIFILCTEVYIISYIYIYVQICIIIMYIYICTHHSVCVCRYATKFRCEHRNPERQTCQELPAAESEGCPVEI